MRRLARFLALTGLLAAFWAPAAQADFGLASLDGAALDAVGDPVTQAGSHPHVFETEFSFNTVPGGGGPNDPPVLPAEDVRDIVASLPPGFLGNPTAAPACTAADFFSGGSAPCPPETQLGTSTVFVDVTGVPEVDSFTQPIYNLTPGFDSAGKFGFLIAGIPVILNATLSTTPPYRALVRSIDTSQILSVYSVRTEFWGIPAEPAHDGQRFCGGARGCASPIPPRSFLSLPTACEGPIETTLDVTSWLGSTDQGSFFSHANGDPDAHLPITGCDQLDFEPTLQARPTTNAADSPSGLDVDLAVPQAGACVTGPPVSCPEATAHLRDTTVTLPEGLTVNPSSANGLGACSPAQVDLQGPDPAQCPDASKVASVEVDTPLLDHPVKGAAYLATPHQNPFNSLIALYITLDDPQSGTVVKLAGEVQLDPQTGQLSATFKDNPQVPFDHFRLRFFGGAGGSLRTPATCGTYTTASQMTPWSAPASGPPETPSDTWSISQSPSGSCATAPEQLPHSPSFDAGVVSPISKSHTPFVVKLRREDGSQNFSAVAVRPPPGLVAKLAGTAICPDSALEAAAAKSGNEEKANPSCPLDSRVGSVTAGAGAGLAPYYASGTAYLSGPHKGAPMSLAIITPATAGPFDLGTIVVKTALQIDPKTTEITAVSDPIPSILEGIPLDVRSVDVSLDKPDFTLTGTSCDPMAVSGLLTSTLGQLASLSSRFQLSDCTRLGFKPRMTLRLRGGTKRGKYPALTAVVIPRPGDANIASVSLALPRSEFLANEHIRTVCTRPDFAADRCPAGAIYGEATVDTPILDYDLSGHIYLRSSDNLLPDAVADLRGPASQPIKLETSGRTDSIKGGIRNTIDFVPDAPFTKATVALQGAGKGLLVNSRDICARVYRATVRYTAHNGLTFVDHPKMRARCGKRGKRRRGHRRTAR